MNRPIDCKSSRRFGVEIELNTFDGDIKKTDPKLKIIPSGMDYIACLVKEEIMSRLFIGVIFTTMKIGL